MPIDFHAESNRFSYTTRQADPSWIAAIQSIVDLVGYIREQLYGNDQQQIVEQDRWTIWSAHKGEEKC
jgi:hypothetical protein